MSSKKKKNKKKSGNHKPKFIQNTKPKIPEPVKLSMIRREVEEDLTESERVVKEFRSQIERENTRKIIKIMCLSLNERYGFGAQRAESLISWMADMINEELEANDDDTGDFWYRIDQALEKKGMRFFPSEDEIKRQQKESGL